MKIYTRTGDKGQTSLFGGERVLKNNKRVTTYGTIDELNSLLGWNTAELTDKKELSPLCTWIENVQKDLFAIGAWIASPKACENLAAGKPAYEGNKKDRTNLNEARIKQIEEDIDNWEKSLEPMTAFILPGGSKAGASLHYTRTICRRAERDLVALRESGELVPDFSIQYLNRLADALFVLARYVNHAERKKETFWS